jgi:hypothetical protein
MASESLAAEMTRAGPVASIKKVLTTLAEAVVLVFFMMLLFVVLEARRNEFAN